jgi:hypothetical protein
MTRRLRQVFDLLLVGALDTLTSLEVLITVFCGEFWDYSFNIHLIKFHPLDN